MPLHSADICSAGRDRIAIFVRLIDDHGGNVIESARAQRSLDRLQHEDVCRGVLPCSGTHPCPRPGSAVDREPVPKGQPKFGQAEEEGQQQRQDDCKLDEGRAAIASLCQSLGCAAHRHHDREPWVGVGKRVADCTKRLSAFTGLDVVALTLRPGRGGGMVDAADSKSVGRKPVRVRLPPPAHCSDIYFTKSH